jgi:phage terminase large subunit-like protein
MSGMGSKNSRKSSSNAPLPASERSLLIEQLKLIDRDLQQRKAERRLSTYQPYSKQAEFHAAGKDHRERCMMAGNQLGKTLSVGMEVAMHLTGLYPEWWEGKRFDRPTRWLCGSASAELTRKGIQRILLGPPETEALWGTGTIPRAKVRSWARRQGVADTIDTITVTTPWGGDSSIQLAGYEQGRVKWSADTVDGVWLDEEPPEDIYMEAKTRTNVTLGPVILSLTPLLGMSTVVKRFYPHPAAGCHLTMMTIDDALHYTAEARDAIIASYPAHEREARTRGIPSLGSGRVFPVTEEDIAEEAIQIPRHWPRICGLDIGWDHPTAAAWLAWDRDQDVIHVYDCYRQREATPVLHAAAIKRRGAWIPVAWPHDALQHDKGSGQQIAELYKQEGLAMVSERASFEDGGYGLEAGVLEMLERMQTGRWRVAAHLNDWWDEFRIYHRRDGKIVKEDDDVLSASRYAMMMLRHAKLSPSVAPAATRGSALAGWMA